VKSQKVIEIIKGQWNGYNKYHQSPTNLWIHIFAVPVFILATFSLISSLISVNIVVLIYSIVLMFGSIGAQGFGHNKETLPAEPFTDIKSV
jgi:uncharacterized membrane protein YGL010W